MYGPNVYVYLFVCIIDVNIISLIRRRSNSCCILSVEAGKDWFCDYSMWSVIIIAQIFAAIFHRYRHMVDTVDYCFSVAYFLILIRFFFFKSVTDVFHI